MRHGLGGAARGARPPALFLLLPLIAAASCGGPDHSWAPHPVSVDAPNPGCAAAIGQRARVPALLDEGKLDRAIRVMQRVEGACAETAEATWAQHVAALAAVGRAAETRQLARRIETSDRATPADLAAAAAARAAADEHDRFIEDAESAQAAAAELFRRGTEASSAGDAAAAEARFQEAWQAWHPFPRALLEAGLAARRLGRAAEAQRLWDRAAFDDPAEPILPEVPSAVRPRFEDPHLAFSPSGRLLALASAEAIAVLDGTLAPRLRITGLGSETTFTSVAFAPGETGIFAGLSTGLVRAWDLATGEPLGELRGHTGEVRLLAFPPRGRTLVTASADRSLRLWDRDTGAVLRVLPLGRAEAVAIAVSEDGGLLAFATDEGKVTVWDAGSGLVAGTLEPRAGPILALVFARTGPAGAPDDKLAVQTSKRRLLYDLSALGAARPRPKAHVDFRSPVELAAAAPGGEGGGGGEIVLALDRSITVQPFGATAPASVFPLARTEGPVMALALSPAGRPEGRWVAAVEAGPALQLYPVGGSGTPRSLRPPEAAEAIAATADGGTIAAAQGDLVRVFRLRTGLAASFASTRPAAFALSPDGALLAASGAGAVVNLWDIESGRLLRSLSTGTAAPALAFSPDGARVAAAGAASRIGVWEAGTGAALAPIDPDADGPVVALRYRPDGASILAASGGRVSLCHVATGRREVFAAAGLGPVDVAWAPDGSSFSVVTASGRLLTGAPSRLGALREAQNGASVLSIAFGQGGETATAEGDGSIALRSATGSLLQRFREPKVRPRAVAFAAGGVLVATFGDGAIRLFRSSSDRAVAVVRPVPDREIEAGAPVSAGSASSPSGHVDFLGRDAPVARDRARCLLGAALYPFDVCAEQFLVPGLLAKVLSGEDPAEADP